MEQHIAYALDVIQTEINRQEMEHGHHVSEDAEGMDLDIQRLKTAIADIREKFDPQISITK